VSSPRRAICAPRDLRGLDLRGLDLRGLRRPIRGSAVGLGRLYPLQGV